MRILGWIIKIVFWALIVAIFHYTLPQHDIVRVTDTYEKRVDFGNNAMFWASADAGSEASANRDVFFIQTRRADDSVMVYRNEDTGWGWPPYFKFDTSNLQAEAADLRSTSESPKWAMLKHYGWRAEVFSIFPNAVSIRPASGPDAPKPIPWVNIIVIFFFVSFVYAIWVRWRRFRAARLDPAFEEIQDNLETTGDALSSRSKSMRRWLRGP